MNKKNIIIMIASISVLLITVIGGSYAYLRLSLVQDSNYNNVISTLSCLEVAISDVSTPITIEDALPTADNTGMGLTGYTFRLKNNCNNRVEAEINLESLSVSNQLSFNYVKYSINGSVPVALNTRSTVSPATISGATSKNIFNTTMAAQEEREFNLKLWILESSTFAQAGNKNFQGKIVVYAKAIKDTCLEKPADIVNATSGTILSKLNSDRYCYKDPITTPGKQLSTEKEDILASTTDDYGTSYYFRGNVGNNYVVFANMCWRIVRITGNDGNSGDYNNATKLILHNYNPNNLANPCNQIRRTYAMARYSGTSYEIAFNTNNTYNAYIGYMYGTPNGGSYEAEHANTKDSQILAKLKLWYDAKLRSYDAYLADTVWCNDKRLGVSGTGYGNTSTRYRGFDRVYPSSAVTNAAPSLACGESAADNHISKFTAQETTYGNGLLKTETNGQPTKYYPIGLLTGDEADFAGYIYNSVANYNYLMENTHSVWLLMTPANGSGSSTIMDINANKLTTAYTKTTYGVRPMISLKSNVEVTGTGTSIDPYVVQPLS